MANTTTDDALREVIEALDKATPMKAIALSINFLRTHADTLRRALTVLAAVEAAPVGEVTYICADDAGAECHVYRREKFENGLLGKRVRLVLDHALLARARGE